MNKIVVLGASSWLGYYFVNELLLNYPQVKVIGTFKTKAPDLSIPLVQLPNSKKEEIIDLLEKESPDIFVNFNRGENQDGFDLHKSLIEYSNNKSSLYGYMSSFNACDADTSKAHLESDVANAKSDYGIFKAKCEKELINTCRKFCIFRFTAAHGWAPNREARTEILLKELANKGFIKHPRGVLKNRTAASHLAKMMAGTLIKEGQGVFNIGTTDFSDELIFLKKLAVAFEYEESSIIEEGEFLFNAVTLPSRIFSLCGKEMAFTEDDTIEAIKNTPELSKYKKTSVS